MIEFKDFSKITIYFYSVSFFVLLSLPVAVNYLKEEFPFISVKELTQFAGLAWVAVTILWLLLYFETLLMWKKQTNETI